MMVVVSLQDKLISLVMGKGTVEDVAATLEQGADPNFINQVISPARHACSLES